MTIVKGQIESLKRIKDELNRKGIKRFNSTGDIINFLKNYEIEKQEILGRVEQDLNIEIKTLRSDKEKFQEDYDKLKIEETSRLNNKIDDLNSRYNLIKSGNRNTLLKVFKLIELKIIESRKKQLLKNFNRIINDKTFITSQKIQETNDAINDYTNNREKVIYLRSNSKIRELTRTKEVVDGLYPLVAGAIGENMVEKELKKLSDKNILFNDFSIDFETPIFNRKENDRIFSIQIDHLLVTNSGIFILETKNWSKKSIENFDLRSPVQQIKRTSYALFVILNSDSKRSGVKLKSHHWGDKQLPIRNVIVLIKNKPREKFKYVEVKTLKELNSYINYFDPIFDDSEVNEISEFLEMTQNKKNTTINNLYS
jgi:hypothetical protein